MKKILKQLVLALILINFALTIQMAVTNADNGTNGAQGGPAAGQGPAAGGPAAPEQPRITPLDLIKSVGEGTNLPGFIESGQHPDTFNLKPGVATVTSPIYYALDIFRYAISGIALIVIIIAAIKLVATSTDEEAEKQKTALVIGVIGLLVIQMADIAVKQMFFGEQGEAFEDLGTAEMFAEETVRQMRGIIGFVQIFLGSAAVLVIVIRGFTLIYESGDEETINNAKLHIVYGLIGLAIVGLSEIIVRGFIFPEGGKSMPNIEVGKKIIIGLTNYMSGFMALFAFAALFMSGYRYVISGGNEEVTEKVKKTVIGAAIALVLSLGAYALVNTFVTLDNTVNKENSDTVSMVINNLL